jgi:diguanylate cyclase (GGDEF)-like protein/putative nucleotidyltransferase with HDIG domain
MKQATTADALAAVRRLSFAMLEAADARGLYRTFAMELVRVFGVDRVHVCRIDEDAGDVGRATAFAPAEVAGECAVEPELEYSVPFDRPTGVRHVRATGEALHVPEAASSPLVSQEFVKRFRAASLLFVPLAFEGRVRSVVVLLSHTPRTFEIAELELAYTLANQASAGLAVLEMRSHLSARAKRRGALVRAARALNASLDLRAVLTSLCAEGARAVGADMAGFYLGDAENGGVAVAAHGIPADSDWWGRTIAPGEGMAGRALVSGEPAVTNDYQLGPRIDAEAMREVETAVGVPVRWDGELKGALSVGFHTLRPVQDEDIDVLSAIADLAAVACSNAEAFERVQVAARTDSLTGFLNHGAVQLRLSEEIWRARREDAPLCCLLVDLDNFKPINDRHGHLVGDELLQQVATAIAAEFRPYDGLARYGGDEFVLVLPGIDEDGALEAAGRLRTVVAETSARFGDLEEPVSASVGIARWREPLTAGELLDRADRALLLAKRRGKDGVAVACAATERVLARIDTRRDRDDPLAGFWDMVSRCERPRHVLYTLSALVRRELELEEVALYEPGAGSQGRSLIRLALARLPGDPSQAAFRRSTITICEDLRLRLESGPISRGSLTALESALEVSDRAPATDPAGSYAAIGLTRGGTLLGLLLMRHRLPQFPLPELRMAEVLAGETATVLLSQSGDGSRTAVAALAAAIDARDNYTMSHSEEVVGLAREVARRLGLSPSEVSKVRDGAMLHDVGKVAIPNEILFKPGPLTDAEWDVMRQHPVIGESILRRTPELAPIAPLVRHEHERWDGGGYPDGLGGDSIPIGSRIILACDAYNAMITARPYREPMSEEAAHAELRGNAGSQFDPRVVEALLAVLGAPVVASGG